MARAVDRGQRLADRVGEAGLLLGDHKAVRRGVVDIAHSLELTIGLLCGIQADRRVSEHRVVLARNDTSGHLALVRVDAHVDRGLASGDALVATDLEVVDLDNTLLNADVQAARVLRVDLLRVAGLGDPLGASTEVLDHVDLLLAVSVDRERRDTSIELARGHAQDDGVEAGGDVLDLDAELGRDGIEDVNVHTLDRLAVGVEELVGGIGRVDANLDDAAALDRVGQHGLEGVVGSQRLERRRAAAGRGAAGRHRVRATGSQSKGGGGQGREGKGVGAEHQRSFHIDSDVVHPATDDGENRHTPITPSQVGPMR